MVEFKIEGKEMIKKVASCKGTSAVIYVPKAWHGHEVILILDGK